MHIFSLLTLTLACGHVLTSKIYGGKISKPHSRPFVVLVKMEQENTSIDYCAGFLVNEWFVMTAAHCQASSYEVYLGLHNINKKKDVQIRSVDKAFPDKLYNASNHAHDVMLLKLNSEVQFNNKVKSIEIANPNDDPPKECMVFGWGLYDSTKKLSNVLREANVTLTDDDCGEEDTYCSYGISGPGNGDSGCPLVCENGKVYGVMSTGAKTNQKDVRFYWYSMISEVPPGI